MIKRVVYVFLLALLWVQPGWPQCYTEISNCYRYEHHPLYGGGVCTRYPRNKFYYIGSRGTLPGFTYLGFGQRIFNAWLNWYDYSQCGFPLMEWAGTDTTRKQWVIVLPDNEFSEKYGPANLGAVAVTLAPKRIRTLTRGESILRRS